jgi:hypothetical protein
VIGGGVGAGIAGAQHAGQRLARSIEIGQQRVKPEPALERPRRPSFSLCAVINVASMSITTRSG